MKQYDKIYVPHPTGDYEVCEIGFEDPERGRFVNEENVIVLTMEELKEIWMAGFNRADPENTDPAPTFQSYLKAKGITI
jgi:hypothetical protein